jgi:hypothetical protein
LDEYTLTRRLHVKFEGEIGLDYGGMSREWFLSLSNEIVNIDHLFRKSGQYHYVIDYQYYLNERSLEYFQFIGMLIGLAVYNNRLFNTYFVPAFFKALIDVNSTLDDVKNVDPGIYKSLKYVKDNNVGDLSLTFCVTENNKEIDLIKGGSEIEVTEENKDDYLNQCVNYYLGLPVEPILAIKTGLFKFINQDMLREFNCDELRKLFSGTEDICVNELKDNTEYLDDFNEDTPVIKFFWNILQEFSQDLLKKFLHFTTGSEKVPIGGFPHLYGSNGPQKFAIKPSININGLPSAHSCFNRLELPRYATEQELKEKLIYAISETEGFGLE